MWRGKIWPFSDNKGIIMKTKKVTLVFNSRLWSTYAKASTSVFKKR